MNATFRRALCGFHNPDYIISFRGAAKRLGYDVTTTSNLQEMLAALDAPPYSHVMMDINLGSPGQPNTDPAQQVYSRLEREVKTGKSRFLAISGNRDTVERARRLGIPADGLRILFSEFLEQ